MASIVGGRSLRSLKRAVEASPYRSELVRVCIARGEQRPRGSVAPRPDSLAAVCQLKPLKGCQLRARRHRPLTLRFLLQQ